LDDVQKAKTVFCRISLKLHAILLGEIMNNLIEKVNRTRVIAILRNSCNDFIDLHLERLVRAGLLVIEVSQSSDTYASSLGRLLKDWSAYLEIGSGTIITIDDAKRALDLGATFLVSPHFDPSLTEFIVAKKVPYVVGCLTPSEAVQALHANVDAIKIFPASLGGPSYIKALLAPLPGTRFVPTGGVSMENAQEYWNAGAWGVGIGSELSNATVERGWSDARLQSFFQGEPE
jgi:2-dehydro-3-deoxyphosphogluconate aldolase / (4S)-4-hydroxy-2-oxoglutarate aldolase